MAKITTKEDIRQQNVAEAVSKTDQFFKENGKIIYSCVIAVLVVALAVIAYNRFILQPKKVQATDQLVKAEQWFAAGEYELALNGDGNDLGLVDIIDQYGAKGGQAVYMYAGVAELQMGNFEEAISYLKKYKGSDPILRGRALANIGDAYVGLGEYEAALGWFQKAAKVSDNVYSAAYLMKAGLTAEELGRTNTALSFYKQIKEDHANAPEASEIDKYITRIENAE
ncbi:MAG: tetratricopeptide repeat protein [Bacteroidales bacterium]|nr:tetratricopeptide repeat protein [Bacteroidales bacterium]MBP5374345.1 tetratricopeptide repeat protein [Bacteroidales bacterium]